MTNPTPGTPPAVAYRAAVASGRFQADPAQAGAAAALDDLYRELCAWRPPKPDLFGRLLRRGPANPPVRGLYLWGGVGRGKTWLMDLLYHALPFPAKRRLHFHRFMQEVHGALTRLQGQPDPLAAVAAGLAAETRVLCLDEMQVNDITDAMLMAGLLRALFERGVTLVTTANVPPDGLYRAGLQRDRFLPAIGLLNAHCRVLELASPTDYRLRQLTQAPVYLMPPGPVADARLAGWFAELTGLPAPAPTQATSIAVNDRDIPVVAATDDTVWFNFDVICHIPRSKLDYVEVARTYATVLVSNIRRLGDEQVNLVQRLITLVDALYDRNCKLIVSAETAPGLLYEGRELAFEFQRTASRLAEMQSEGWLAREHLG